MHGETVKFDTDLFYCRNGALRFELRTNYLKFVHHMHRFISTYTTYAK